MGNIFIAHVEEDADVALEIALGLEEAGYTTWIYEVDSIPGPSYLIQTGAAVAASKAIIVVISPHSLGSRQVTKEVVRAHESGIDFIPVLRGVTHAEFQNRQPEWREAVGAAASTSIPREGVAPILPRIVSGLGVLGIVPSSRPDATKIAQIRRALSELPGHAAAETTVEQSPPAERLEPKPIATGATPPIITTETTGKQRKWKKPAFVASGVVVVAAAIVIITGLIQSQAEHTIPTSIPAAPAAKPKPAVTQEPTKLFYDDFESGTIESWRIPFIGGTAKIGNMDGNRYLDSTDYVVCVAGENSWADYNVKARVLLLEGTARIRFRHHPYPYSSNVVDAYEVWLSEGKYSLNKIRGNPDSPLQVKELARTDAPIVLKTWHSVTIVCKRNEFTVDIDQVKVTFADNEMPILSGAIALSTRDKSHAFFDDILVVKETGDTQTTSTSPPPPLPTPSPTTSVTFPDKNLDKAIRTALGKQLGDGITEAELAKLTRLETSQKGISDLTGISYLVNLTELVLFSNQISDVSALSSLTKLNRLSLHGNQISNIQPLSTLTSLEMLTLDTNQISDIRPLSSLINLSKLHLSGNRISNIYSLSSFTKLNSLYLHSNQITDIQPLATNSGLSAGDIVTLQGNPLSSTSVNDYVPQLEKKDVIVLVNSSPQEVYQDKFDNPTSGWPVVSNDQYEVSYKNGEYYFIEKKGGLSFLRNQSAGQFTDFILEADVRLVSGPNQNAFGIIFRVLDSQQDFYFFKVTANGYYVVGKRLNGIPQVILNKESGYLQKGYNTNHLKVVCKGPMIAVYVNGNYLTTITDGSFVEGYIGVTIGPGTSELVTTAAFDNFRVDDISTHSP